jgi:mono/diheme cytochrome c family protein
MNMRYLKFLTIFTLGLLLLLSACAAQETDEATTTFTPDTPSEPPATSTPHPPTPDLQIPTITPAPTFGIPETGNGLAQVGADIYEEACAACHQLQGQGISQIYPPLNGSGFVTAQDPDPLIAVIITGRGGMPTFHDILTSEEIAAVVSYIRTGWDNQAETVSVEQVEQVWGQTGFPMEEDEEED